MLSRSISRLSKQSNIPSNPENTRKGAGFPASRSLASFSMVRTALKELADEELVIRRQGKGTYVGKKKFKRNLSLVTSFSEACRDMGRVPGAKLLFSGLEPATEADCAALQISPGDEVVCLRRLRYADSIPVSVEEDRFPLRYSFLLGEDLTDRSLLELLRENGIYFYDVHRRIELVYATHSIAQLLNLPIKSPLLYIVSNGLDNLTNQPGQRSLQYIIGEDFTFYT